MTLRDSIALISPPWLQRRIARRLQWAATIVLDAEWDLVREGIKARMPGAGTPEALPYIGDDRLIERGPTESAISYADRLSRAFDTWRTMGNPRPLLEQLRAYFLPNPVAMRVVSNASIWHEIDPSTAAVTRYIPEAPNWIWDSYATGPTPRWWRGWVIIDSSAGPWSQWFIGEPGITLGDGHTIGSTATINEISSLRRIVGRCKPAHVHAYKIILLFNSNALPKDGAPDSNMPDGDWDNPSNRDVTEAAYITGVV